MSDQIPARVAVRAAARVLDALARGGVAPVPELPLAAWRRLAQADGRLRECQSRSWHAALTIAAGSARYYAAALRRLLEDYERRLNELAEPQPAPALKEIYRDVQALQQEFPSVAVDLRQKSLSVETDPVILDGVELGPFAIILQWNRLGLDPPYRVVALEPTGQSGTPHPHVREGLLCEGEGKGAIRRALLSGRLLDFFVLVRQVLRTYNPESAFSPLEDWEGAECDDCGARVDPESSWSCGECGCELCDDCERSCADCSSTRCAGCAKRCARCEEDHCQGCLRRCPGCDDGCCRACLGGTGRCEICQPEPENQTDDPQDSGEPGREPASAPAAHGAAEPVRMGEAVVRA